VLLTGDTGIWGLTMANCFAIQKGLAMQDFMLVQIPHHGSRRNVGPSILNTILGPIKPNGTPPHSCAFVSAPRDDDTHPREMVLNAFIRRGYKIAAMQGNKIVFWGGFPARSPRCRSPRRWKTMTNASGAEAAPHGAETGKSLKDQNRWQLWIIVAVNSLFLYGVMQANSIKAYGLRAAFTDAQNLVPVGFALVIATVLNGLLSADMKARLVFLRWHHALPGHRAFSKYAVSDARIDLAALERLHGCPLPVDPVEQNRVWYRIYKTVENDQAVRQVHGDFLLLRDYTGLCAVFIAFYGAAGLYAIRVGEGLPGLFAGARCSIRRGGPGRIQLRHSDGHDGPRPARRQRRSECSEDPDKTTAPQNGRGCWQRIVIKVDRDGVVIVGTA
jgi:hypothetical protein